MTNNENNGQIILYSIDNQKEFVNVVFKDETFWLTQKAMAELFDVNPQAITYINYVKDGKLKMKISDVRVRLVKKDESKLKAVASITLDDCFVVHDIKVIEGNEGYFIAMPSRKTADGEYKDIAHPIKTEMRENLIKAILSAFEEEKAKPAE